MSIKKSLRRHAKRNHASTGGASHMGRAQWKVRKDNRKDDRPEPMKVPLADWIGAPVQVPGSPNE